MQIVGNDIKSTSVVKRQWSKRGIVVDLPQSRLIDTKVALLLNVTDRVDRELSTQPPRVSPPRRRPPVSCGAQIC